MVVVMSLIRLAKEWKFLMDKKKEMIEKHSYPSPFSVFSSFVYAVFVDVSWLNKHCLFVGKYCRVFTELYSHVFLFSSIRVLLSAVLHFVNTDSTLRINTRNFVCLITKRLLMFGVWYLTSSFSPRWSFCIHLNIALISLATWQLIINQPCFLNFTYV